MSFPRYPKYKASGVEWLGSVPEHWEVKRSDSFLTYSRSQLDPKEFQGREVFHYSIPVVQEIGTGQLEDGSEIASGKQVVKEKVVLVSKLNPRKATVCIAEPQKELTLCSTEFVALEPTRCDIRYLSYLVRTECFRQGLESKVTSVTNSHQRANPADIYRFWNAWPVLPEQTAIAEFLDRETGKIDALVAEQQRLIELLREKRQAVISHAVTKGLDPKVKMKNSSVEWIGEIPNHWTAPPVASFCTIVRGASPRPAGDPEFFNGSDTPWITVAETTKDNEKYLTETSEHLTAEGRKRSRFLDVDTFVLTNSGATLGVPKILRISGCINDGSVAFLNIDRRISKDFLYYYFTSQTADIRIRMNQGMGQPNLNTNIVSRMPIPCPPQNEQVLIASYLDAACARLKSQVKAIHDSIEFMDEYRTALISAAVTGQIDVREEVKLNG